MTRQVFVQMSGAPGAGKTTIAGAIAGRIKTRSGDQVFREWIMNMKRPDHNYLVLDTTRPLDICVEKVMQYIARRTDE